MTLFCQHLIGSKKKSNKRSKKPLRSQKSRICLVSQAQRTGSLFRIFCCVHAEKKPVSGESSCSSHTRGATPFCICPVHLSLTWTVNPPLPQVYSLLHPFISPSIYSPSDLSARCFARLCFLPGRRPICLLLCLFSVQQVH